MPSHLHETLLLLFRNRPSLAAELLRDVLDIPLPYYNDARIDSAELTDIQPAEYRADLVALLSNGRPVLGIVVEVQLSRDEDKRFAWPAYVVNLRARLRCPACMLVVAAEDSVARWAAKPVSLGGRSNFAPLVLGPSSIPEIVDESRAEADPELAVLSAMAHGLDADIDKAARIGRVAQEVSARLDADRSRLYVDLVFHSLSEAARRALQNMNPAKYEYKSDFARQYISLGRQEGGMLGERSGRAALVARLLGIRFGDLSQAVQDKLTAASIAELDAVGERLLTAATLAEAMGDLR